MFQIVCKCFMFFPFWIVVCLHLFFITRNLYAFPLIARLLRDVGKVGHTKRLLTTIQSILVVLSSSIVASSFSCLPVLLICEVFFRQARISFPFLITLVYFDIEASFSA